jgi:hypothetical protein
MFAVIIHFADGSTYVENFKSFWAARDYCQNHISYSGGRVRRVEIDSPHGDKRAMWDISWDDVSKYHGLND